MSISVKNNQFHLKTKNTSYIFSVYKEKYLTHLYWGKKIENEVDFTYFPDAFIFSRANAFHVPADSTNQMFLSDLQLEFSVVGGGDYRTPTFQAKYENGSTVTEFEYESYTIYDGKKKLAGLPATYAENAQEAQTLEIILTDRLTGLKVILCYSVFEEFDVITRNIRYENTGNSVIHILSAQSASVDFHSQNYKVLHLQGDWARERSIECQDVKHGIITIDSKRGMSSHMNNPFVALLDKNATEYEGNVFGFSFVYSGSFSANVEGNSCGGTRVCMGINPHNFDWTFAAGDTFCTPEVVMVFSDCGINRMSQIYHEIYRNRLCRGKFRDAERPMVINNWEGTTFDFDEKKLIDIAYVGSKMGLELFVLDDGWFGKRNDDKSSLGDWFVNMEKLPNGLGGVSKAANEMGMKFGLWFEPEMVSPDSELYRKHPDWCIFAENRKRTENRQQLVLDFSKDAVCDYIIHAVSEVLKSANIEYVKWDCNRNLTETANQMQPHRYILGLYQVLETLTERFPNVLFEGCSGGGGRFDAGLLYYMPQTWTSDNTNPIARLSIQYGTSLVYPPITMTAHVGSIDVGYNRENKFMNTCAMVAMAGNFGYELDLSLLSDIETEQAKKYVELYKQIRPVIQFGDFYRIESPFEGSNVSWQYVSKDQTKAVVFVYQTRSLFNGEQRRIQLHGLNKNTRYMCNGRSYFGEELMSLGLRIALSGYEYESNIMLFDAID